MRDLQSLKVFLAVARHRSFAEAARRLAMTPASVTRAIAAVEADLQHQLFVRTTRQVSLTHDGAALAARLRPLIADVDMVLEDARAGPGAAHGTLKISVPLSFGVRVMPDILAEFRQRYPGISLRCEMSDAFVDVLGRGFDLALRISAAPEGKSAIWRKLAKIERLLVAAPGTPETFLTSPAGLDPARCLGHSFSEEPEIWALSDGQTTRKIVAGAEFAVNNGDVLALLAKAGHGVAQLPRFLCAEALEAGDLVPILPDWTPSNLWLSLTYPPFETLPPPVALFSDFIETRLLAQFNTP